MKCKHCDCFDPGCEHVRYSPINSHLTTLYRIDTEDLTGTDFCTVCYQDAIDSGLFTQEEG